MRGVQSGPRRLIFRFFSSCQGQTAKKCGTGRFIFGEVSAVFFLSLKKFGNYFVV